MLTEKQLENMYIGFHGSSEKFDKFQHCQYYSTYTNSGLGVFVAKDIKGAIPYSYNSNDNTQGYVYMVAFSKNGILEVNEDLFFCLNEPCPEVDSMGYPLELDGTATREQYLMQGYTGFKLANLDDCGEAFAVFNPESIIILDVLTTYQAIEKSIDLSTKMPFRM